MGEGCQFVMWGALWHRMYADTYGSGVTCEALHQAELLAGPACSAVRGCRRSGARRRERGRLL